MRWVLTIKFYEEQEGRPSGYTFIDEDVNNLFGYLRRNNTCDKAFVTLKRTR